MNYNEERLCIKKLTVRDISTFFYIFAICIFDNSIVFYLACLFFFFIHFLCIVRKGSIRFSHYLVWSAFFLIFSFVQTFFFAVFFETALKRWFVVLVNFFLSFLLVDYLSVKENRSKCCIFFLVSSLILVLYLFLKNPLSFFQARFGNQIDQPFGVGVPYNGNNVVRILYTAFVFSLLYWQKSKRPVYLFFFLLFFSTVVFSGGRAGLFISLTTVGLYYLFIGGDRKKKIKTLIIMGIAFLLIWYLLMNNSTFYAIIGQRIEVLVNGFFSGEYEYKTSAYYRNSMLKRGIELFCQRPVVGFGLDSYASISGFGVYSHNNFIELLVSTGLIGFVLFYASILSIVFSLNKKRKKQPSDNEIVLIFSFLISCILYQIGYIAYLNRVSIFLYVYSSAITLNPSQQEKSLK